MGPQSSSGVQKQAAAALWNLASNDDNKVKIWSESGVAALTQLMDSTTDKEVKAMAKGALDNL